MLWCPTSPKALACVIQLFPLFFLLAGGMPPTPQAVQLTGQKQSQQQYDPSKGPPVQNAASLHTPPPQLPGRLQSSNVPLPPLPATLQLTQPPQPPITDSLAQPQIHVKAQPQSVSVAAAVPHGQVQVPLQQQVQSAALVQGQITAQVSQAQAPAQQQVFGQEHVKM